MQQIAVTLLATSNPHVAPTLPARGLLEITAVGTRGEMVSGTWTGLDADGAPGVPVAISDAVFTVANPGFGVDREAAATAALNDLLDSLDDVEDISARVPDMVRAVLDAADGPTDRGTFA